MPSWRQGATHAEASGHSGLALEVHVVEEEALGRAVARLLEELFQEPRDLGGDLLRRLLHRSGALRQAAQTAAARCDAGSLRAGCARTPLCSSSLFSVFCNRFGSGLTLNSPCFPNTSSNACSASSSRPASAPPGRAIVAAAKHSAAASRMRGLLLLAEQLVHGADNLVAESLRFSETKAIRVAYDRRDGARRQLREGWSGAIATWFVRAVGVFLREVVGDKQAPPGGG